jgi:hypothetical protein
MIKAIKDKLFIGNNEIKFTYPIEKVVEFENCVVVSYWPQTDSEYSSDISGGLCCFNKNSKGVKWSISKNPLSIRKVDFNGQKALNIRIDDIIQIINPNTGEVLFETPTKG